MLGLACLALPPATRGPRALSTMIAAIDKAGNQAAVVLALTVAAALWLAGGLGGILTGTATDPGTGPLLALLALAFWPAAAPRRGSANVRPVY